MRSQIFNLIKDQTTLTWEQIAANILVSGILGFLIFISYMISHRGTIYSKKFNVSLVVLTVLTSMVMTVIGNNIALSLGMVGALSIVRFRTAIKDPMDLVFLFWSISVGIICGARLYVIAVILCVFVTVVLFALDKVPTAKAPKILVVNASDVDAEDAILEVVDGLCSYYKVKSRSLSADQLDMVVELRVKEEKELVNGIHELEAVQNVSLLAHDGEVTF